MKAIMKMGSHKLRKNCYTEDVIYWQRMKMILVPVYIVYHIT